jgi:hypothetical protein
VVVPPVRFRPREFSHDLRVNSIEIARRQQGALSAA